MMIQILCLCLSMACQKQTQKLFEGDCTAQAPSLCIKTMLDTAERRLAKVLLGHRGQQFSLQLQAVNG